MTILMLAPALQEKNLGWDKISDVWLPVAIRPRGRGLGNFRT